VSLLAGLMMVLVILTILASAVLSTAGGGDSRSFTPNNWGLLPGGAETPGFGAGTVDGASF
jgi:hypothetical protein